MAELESPVLEVAKTDVIIDKPKYSTKEEDYLRGLRKRMESARNAREQERDEFDGMAYATAYEV